MLQIFQRNQQKNTVDRKISTLANQLSIAFQNIKNDMNSINNSIKSNKSELSQLNSWVQYLHQSQTQISDAHSKLLQKQSKIEENHDILHSSHRKLTNSHGELRDQHTKTAKTAAELAKNIELKHDELKNTVLAHKLDIQGEIDDRIHKHTVSHTEEIQNLKSWVDYVSTQINAQKAKEEALQKDLQRTTRNWAENYSRLRELVNGFHQDHNTMKKSVNNVENQLESTKSELKTVISNVEQSSMELSETRKKLDLAMDDLKNLQKNGISEPKPQEITVQPQNIAQQQVQQPVNQIPVQMQPTSSSFQKHILQRVMPNRKGYVLKYILDLIKENRYSTKELEEICVREKQLCGRTSFYAYLKELKLKGRINYAEIDERTILVNTDVQQTL